MVEEEEGYLRSREVVKREVGGKGACPALNTSSMQVAPDIQTTYDNLRPYAIHTPSIGYRVVDSHK